ncbi:hypothetical protein LLJM4_04460 [Lactococcus cremoris]|nr:hypothetical protein [Lactococcus cremoris]WMB99096.1 hypothetical protein LLJM4_04460 [Lactococcus cremoris]
MLDSRWLTSFYNLRKAIKEPAATDTNTLEEVQNAAIEKIMAQASAAY